MALSVYSILKSILKRPKPRLGQLISQVFLSLGRTLKRIK